MTSFARSHPHRPYIGIGFVLAILIATPSTSPALTVTMTVTTDNSSTPVVLGETNLPDGIELLVSLSRKESSYAGSAKTTVANGKFRAGPFSQGGTALNPGTYKIEVNMQGAALQPPPTWPVIGNGGAKLEGPLVKRAPVGGTRHVEYETKCVIGDGKPSPEQDKASREKFKVDLHDWRVKSCKDGCDLSKTYAANNHEKFDWERCYYACVADIPDSK